MLRQAKVYAIALCTCLVSTHNLYSQPTARSSAKESSNSLLGASASPRTISYALDRINQRRMPLDHNYTHPGTGMGVTVYVVDGGISLSHPELSGRVRRGYTTYPRQKEICSGHGTVVAGAIAGKTLGVASEAQIVDVRADDCMQIGISIRDFAQAARWIIKDHKKNRGPAVVNWSYTMISESHDASLDSTITKLNEAGISVVVSAGNFDKDACMVVPANALGVISVGATGLYDEPIDSSGMRVIIDERMKDSAWGTCVDIYAPGVSVVLPDLKEDLLTPDVEARSGTSISAGFVSGAIALYLENHRNATPNEVRSWLEGNATLNVVAGSKSTVSRLLYIGSDNRSDSHFLTNLIP